MSFRFKNRPAFLGGAGLLFHYSLHLLHGLRTGRILWDDMTSPLGRLDGILFTSTFIAIDIALLSIYFGLKGQRAKSIWLLSGGAFASVVAILSEMVGITSFLLDHLVQFAMALGCLSMFVSALLLGIASLWQTVPAMTKLALLLIVFALTTAPLGFAFDALRVDLPKYIFVELHFVIAGSIWLMIGRICQSLAQETQLKEKRRKTLATA